MKLASVNRVTRRGYKWTLISRDEGIGLRALAILAILLHNYMHWVSDVPGENEFTFRLVRVEAFLHGLWMSPEDSVRLLASYLGHYGVQVFFFLSGYGLVKKYGAELPNWWFFQKCRWAALYPAVLVSALGYIIYDGIRLGWSDVIETEGLNLLRQILGVSNFLPDNVYHPIGPWWFIGVIIQFYLIFPLILKVVSRYGDRALYGLCALTISSEFLLGPGMLRTMDVYVNHTILGCLDVCLLGVWFARKGELVIPWWGMTGSGILFVLGNFYYPLWVISGMTLLLFLLPLMRMACRVIRANGFTATALMFFGNLSLYLFLCNGYLRSPMIEIAQKSSHWWVSIWSYTVFLIIVVIWALLLRGVQSSFVRLLRSVSKDELR